MRAQSVLGRPNGPQTALHGTIIFYSSHVLRLRLLCLFRGLLDRRLQTLCAQHTSMPNPPHAQCKRTNGAGGDACPVHYFNFTVVPLTCNHNTGCRAPGIHALATVRKFLCSSMAHSLPSHLQLRCSSAPIQPLAAAAAAAWHSTSCRAWWPVLSLVWPAVLGSRLRCSMRSGTSGHTAAARHMGPLIHSCCSSARGQELSFPSCL